MNTTPRKIAIALEYDGENAPLVSASGTHELADKIIEVAREHGIPLHEDEQLVEVLAQIPLGDEIPESLYRAVAEVIAFAYLLSGKLPKDFTP